MLLSNPRQHERAPLEGEIRWAPQANNATDFRILEMMTSRKLRLAKHLIENAARGRFPDQSEPDHMVEFDAKEFSEIISARNRWIKQEYKKIKSSTGS